jgi:hypothetical protein
MSRPLRMRRAPLRPPSPRRRSCKRSPHWAAPAW